MTAIVTTELVCAVFMLILLRYQFGDHDAVKSARILRIVTATILIWLIIDAVTFSTNMKYFPTLLSYMWGNIVAFFFVKYCEAYIEEKTSLNRWTFRIPAIISILSAVMATMAFLFGKVVAYKDGQVLEVYGLPLCVEIAQFIVVLFPIVVAILKRKTAGLRCIVMFGFFALTPLIATVAFTWTEYDYTVTFSAIAIMALVVVLQNERRQDNIKEHLAHKVLTENAARFFTLEDNFESLYDVELYTGRYEVYTKGEFYKDNVIKKLTVPNDYFAELRVNIDAVIYPIDRDGLYSVLQRDGIITLLSENERFEYYYRLITDKGPVWFKMRIVYKDDTKRNVIIGVFNAAEEMAAKEKEEERLRQTELQLRHEKLRAEILNYMVNNEDDPIELLKNYAEQIRTLVDCDQVIYRDLEQTRIMVNSPVIENSWSVPIEYCQQCKHFDAHHPMYKDGYTEMSNCQEGWHGIPVYKDCPIKSSLTRIVYCDGKVAGYLAIHYVEKYHQFNDIERTTIEEFTRILSMSLSRYEAKKSAGELNSVKKTLSMTFALSDQYDPIIVIDPETGEYDWLMSVAEDVVNNTSMSKHGDNVYKNIGIDSASIIHEEDRAQFQKFYTKEHMMKIAQTGEAQETENRWFIHTENKYRWKYNKAVRMVDETGKVYVVVGVKDTTEEKEKQKEYIAEKKLFEERQAIAENAARFFALEDTFESLYDVEFDSGKYSSYVKGDFYQRNVNDKLITPTDFFEDLRVNIREVIFEEDREGLFNALTREAIRKQLSENEHFDYYYRLITSEGPMWFKMRVVYKDAQKKNVIIGVFNASNDVEAKQIEEQNAALVIQKKQLETARVAADAANKAKTNFLFNMSHDIRTPMNAIRGFTTMAKKSVNNQEKVIEYLNKIDISGQQLLTLINQVLEMARIESGKAEFEEKPVTVLEEYYSMTTVLSEQARTKGIHFESTFNNIKHNYVLADEARISSITLNIVGNAMKYTPEGGSVKFDFSEIESRKSGYATFKFTVADTGIGMSKEFLKDLYKPFTREKNSTVSKIQGTGLGMSIVKNTIDLMGGNIEVQSELGKGTRFDITVDFKINDKSQNNSEEDTDVNNISFKGRRVLLVDDNEYNREIAKSFLEDHDIIVEEAEDGEEAVALVKGFADNGEFHYYDFILMDVQMPRMNGYEATKAIRAIPGPDGVHMPIIAMTANAFEEDRKNALAAGMDEHLAKPIDVQVMFNKIAKFLK